jgi:hypothetical protein
VVRRYPNGYHMLLRDLDGAAVQQDTADWVLNRAQAVAAMAPKGNAGVD